MKYSEAKRYAEDLREFADLIELHGPAFHNMHPSAVFTVYLTQSDYVKVGDEYKSVPDEEQTKKNIRTFVKTIGSCTKNFSGTSLSIKKTFKNGCVTLEGYASREAVCKRVPTGRVIVREAYVIPRSEEEEYEWDCSDAESLLKV